MVKKIVFVVLLSLFGSSSCMPNHELFLCLMEYVSCYHDNNNYHFLPWDQAKKCLESHQNIPQQVMTDVLSCGLRQKSPHMYNLILLWKDKIDINLTSDYWLGSLFESIIREYSLFFYPSLKDCFSKSFLEEVIAETKKTRRFYNGIHNLVVMLFYDTIDINKASEFGDTPLMIFVNRFVQFPTRSDDLSELKKIFEKFLKTFYKRIDFLALDQNKLMVFDRCQKFLNDTSWLALNKIYVLEQLTKYRRLQKKIIKK